MLGSGQHCLAAERADHIEDPLVVSGHQHLVQAVRGP